jgi:MFS family permease
VCRLFTGLGVAGLSTAATMTLSDISTPLNRASTMAPIMSAFAAGTALGPALGGVLCDSIGIAPTFYLVGVSYFGLAAVNMALLRETQPKPMHFPWQQVSLTPPKEITFKESFETAVGQWVPLLSNPPVRNVCIMNGFYWIALAGAQMTLLPLILTDPHGLAMTATQVGQVYMGMSLVQVLGNPIFAKGIDTFGKVPGIVGGCSLIASAMATLPMCSDMYQMAGTLGVWAIGSSLLSTAPISYVSDTVDGEKRAQAIALLRTSGDVGFLIGASSMGALADWTGSLGMAMEASAGILLTATGWFTARQLLTSKLPPSK